jgi:hypothetical protein
LLLLYHSQKPCHLPVDSIVLIYVGPRLVCLVVVSLDEWTTVHDTIAHSSDPCLDIDTQISGGVMSDEALHDRATADGSPTIE